MNNDFENTVVRLVKENKDITGYKLVSIGKKSRELFLIKDKLDMNRGKTVNSYTLSVYREFEEKGEKYKGVASVVLAPTLAENEIKEKIAQAAFSAKFVKNKWYPMSKPTNEKPVTVKTDIDAETMGNQLSDVAKAILKPKSQHAKVNSAEIFLTRSKIHILNSEGVDLSYDTGTHNLEVITDCKGTTEDVEVYGDASYSTLSTAAVQQLVESQLQETESRSVAQKAKRIEKIPVILRNSAVPSFFNFFIRQANGNLVFAQSSKAIVGKNFQGENVKGDKLTITLKPFIENSPFSMPFDLDGIVLHDLPLYENGVVKNIACDIKMAEYLGLPVTGSFQNAVVAAGSKSYEQMCREPYVEILRFSDFLCDSVTGDFGGEFRLAKYFDGKQMHVINNGAISANIFTVQKEMYFSKETMQRKWYLGPKAILIPGLEISGE